MVLLISFLTYHINLKKYQLKGEIPQLWIQMPFAKLLPLIIKPFTIFHFLSNIEIPKMFQFPISQTFANLKYVFLKVNFYNFINFYKTFQRMTITVLDLFSRNTRFPVSPSYLIFVGEPIYQSRNQYHSKLLRWRALQQCLTTFCR